MMPIRDSLVPVLEQMLPRPAVKSILATLPSSANAIVGSLDLIATRELLGHVEVGLRTFGGRTNSAFLEKLRESLTGGQPPRAVEQTLPITSDGDVLMAQRASQVMLKGFFSSTDCVRLTTVVSELARNIYMYAGKGHMTLTLAQHDRRVRFVALAVDRGPGIPNVDEILSGGYVSKTGLGRGLIGAKRIFDELEIDTGPSRGTKIRGVKLSRT